MRAKTEKLKDPDDEPLHPAKKIEKDEEEEKKKQQQMSQNK